MSEINYYLTPSMSEELFVDTSRGSKLRINLDIIVPSISCDRKYKQHQHLYKKIKVIQFSSYSVF